MVKSKNISKIAIAIILLLSQLNTFSQKITSFDENKNGIEFFLPKLQLEIKIDVTKITHNPEFSTNIINKYMPLPLQKHKSPTFDITSITTNKIWIPDSNKHFIILHSSKQKFYFNQSMILLSINTSPTYNTNLTQHNLITKQTSPPSYNQFFIKKNYKKTTDTTYKTIIRDSIAIKKPIYTKILKNKTEEDKVNDLIHYLVKTRKRKFRLISGLDTNNYNPITYKERLKNLDSLENKLYSIITGKNDNTLSYLFAINLNKEIDTIAYFSSTNGIDTIGIPIIIKLNHPSKQSQSTSKSKIGIPYNLPTLSNIEIWLGNQLLYTENIIVPQYSKVNYITTPIKSIEYYPWGSIKNITFK